MTTYQSSKVVNSTNKLTATQARSEIGVVHAVAEFTVATNLVTADVIEMIKIPKGAVILDATLSSSASVGSTGSLSLGDVVDADRFITSTAYTAAVFARMNASSGNLFKYTEDDTIDIRAVNIATPATGAILRLSVIYSTDDLI